MSKIEKFLFYFFIFSIPFQTRKILFSTPLTDNFFEWLFGFFYLTDLLLIVIFALWIKRAFFQKAKFVNKSDLLVILFFFIVLLSLITSQNLKLSVYQAIKLAEFILLFLYIKYNFEFLKIKSIFKTFIASGALQSLLAISQFFNQSNLGLKHIEAGTFNAGIAGTATFFVNGVKFIRAYGTAPHPNVLAVFLLVSVFCVYALWLKNTKKSIINYGLLVTSYGLLFFGLFLTFSRAVIVAFVGISVLFFIAALLKLPKSLRSKIITLFILLVVFCLLFIIVFWPEFQARFFNISSSDQAVSLRVYYNDIAVSAIRERPVFGLGIGNFVWYLFNNYRFQEFWLYQPVHNLYLLIASEIGILGLIIFLIFLWKVLFGRIKDFFLGKINIISLCFLFLVSCFLLLGLIDHYFWTIQQSRLLFWVALGMIAGLSFKNLRLLLK